MGGRGSSSGNVSKLPKLEGSEKQVKWAEDIRSNVVQMIKAEKKVFEQNKTYFSSEYDKEMYEDYKKYSKEALKETKASKWIDGFRNVQYKTNSYIGSLKKGSSTSDTGYIADIKDKMHMASIAYRRFSGKPDRY